MRYRKLGRWGVNVSVVGLGSWLTYGGAVGLGAPATANGARKKAQRTFTLTVSAREVRRLINADRGPTHCAQRTDSNPISRAPALRDSLGRWTADYIRLRFAARRD